MIKNCMLRKLFISTLALALMMWCAGTTLAEGAAYNQLREIMDWGPATTKLIVDMGQPIEAEPIEPDAFSVHVVRTDQRVEDGPIIGEGERKVLQAYVSDAEGNKVDKGSFVTLEMDYGFTDPLSSPMNYYGGTNVWIDCAYTITQVQQVGGVEGVVATLAGDIYAPQLSKFALDGRFTYQDPERGGMVLSYADYKPAGVHAASGLPLIIWLHGGGEGGTDASVPLSANRACKLADDEVQAFFGGEAYVLVPQSPTYWMDDGTDVPYNEKTENKSIYSGALMAMIESYVQANPGIDTDRIYLGGCSNGGYMTMLLILDNPEYFAAAFPVCEAAADQFITDEQLQKIVHLPIWFVAAASDDVVPAYKYALPTYDRLIKLGAENVWLSYPKYVEDMSGTQFAEDGGALKYPGHWSWIYVYNNDLSQCIDGEQVSFMEWLAAQNK